MDFQGNEISFVNDAPLTLDVDVDMDGSDDMRALLKTAHV
jgi:hypothetical protein